MNEIELKAWLESDEPELESAIIRDIENHVNKLQADGGESFYGYAVLPADYCTAFNPASIVIAFNRESNLEPENKDKAYYRCFIDEWHNYVHDGFESTNSALELRDNHSRDEDDYVIDEFEKLYIGKINRTLLNALLKLKQNGTFDENKFLIVWYPDSVDKIMIESAKSLNNPDVYEKFASEFA